MFYDFQTESMETMKNEFLNTFQHYGFSIAPQIFELLPIVPQKSAYWMEFWLVFYRVPVLLLNVREYLQDCTYFLCGYSNFSIPLCYLANTIVFDSVKSARNFLMGGFLKKTS